MSLLSDAFAYFTGQGWTPVQAAGIVGNLQYESALNANENTGDGGTAYGIAQWHSDRQAIFQNVFGKSIRDATFQEQLQFVNYELTQGTYAPVGNALRATNDVSAATRLVMQGYEAPSASSQTNSIAARIAIAQNIANMPSSPNDVATDWLNNSFTALSNALLGRSTTSTTDINGSGPVNGPLQDFQQGFSDITGNIFTTFVSNPATWIKDHALPIFLVITGGGIILFSLFNMTHESK